MEYVVNLANLSMDANKVNYGDGLIAATSLAIAERLEALVGEVREANKSLKLIANKGEGR